jgi:hypothetical protein
VVTDLGLRTRVTGDNVQGALATGRVGVVGPSRSAVPLDLHLSLIHFLGSGGWVKMWKALELYDEMIERASAKRRAPGGHGEDDRSRDHVRPCSQKDGVPPLRFRVASPQKGDIQPTAFGLRSE